jgi:hypothetical protein
MAKRFSQRYGFYEKIENVLQIDSMNETLKTSLWNIFYGVRLDIISSHGSFLNHFTK